MKTNDTTELTTFDSRYTFWKLLNEYKIEIPIIQRDYAQGRQSANASSIRKELLDSIYSALTSGNGLDFDFVYGTVDGETLYPLDGQQRLTTFFLLHWYLAEKEGKIREATPILERFSYTTRVSSREFCSMLVRTNYTPMEGTPVSTFLRNENKYFHSWDNDPTIKAMLVMLDAIHEMFYYCEPLFDALTNEQNRLITFNYLPMEHYRLTDDLYIKMNARGKALSIFENFKAKFIQHLRKSNMPYEHFERNIDGQWTDLLWDYRSSNNTIDKQFMNLFVYFTEMIYLYNEERQEGDSPFRYNDIRKLVAYYDTEEKVNMLYSLLDLWSGKEEAETYLNDLLCTARTSEKICLFGESANIFSDIVYGNPVTLLNRILLFAIMNRLCKLGKNSDKEAMKDYARIVRNFLIQSRFFSSGKCLFTSDFRFGRNGIPYVQFFCYYLAGEEKPYEVIQKGYSDDYDGINSEIFAQEAKKAQIIIEKPNLKSLIQGFEDLDVFRASIFNVLDYLVAYEDESIIEDMETLLTEENGIKIIQALLSIFDYGIRLGSSFLGDRYYYGNRAHLYELFTYQGGEKYKDSITALIREYQNSEQEYINEALDEIINNNLQSISISDWRYCLIKYPSTLDCSGEITNKNLIFAFEKSPATTILHRMNGKTLNAIHVVPEYIEVASRLDNDCIGEIYGHNSDDSGNIKLACHENIAIGWDRDGRVCINYQSDSDKPLIDQAIEQYDSLDIEGKDRVERLLQMANIIKNIDK